MSGSGRATQNVRDRRTARTEAALARAFFEELTRTGYEALTVAGLADAAGVGRSTFYDHFTGKEGLLAHCIAVPFGRLAGIVGNEWGAAELLPLLAHFWQNRRYARVLFAPPTHAVLQRCLAGLIEARLVIRPGGIPASVVAWQVAGLQLGLVEPFVAGRAGCGASVVAEALVAASRGCVAALRGG